MIFMISMMSYVIVKATKDKIQSFDEAMSKKIVSNINNSRVFEPI